MDFVSMLAAVAAIKAQALLVAADMLAVAAIKAQALLVAANAFVLSPFFPLFLYIVLFLSVYALMRYIEYKAAEQAKEVMANMGIIAAQTKADEEKAKQEDVAVLAKEATRLNEKLPIEQLKINKLQKTFEAATVAVNTTQLQADTELQENGEVSLKTQFALAKAQVEALKANNALIYARYEVSELAVQKAAIESNFDAYNPILKNARTQFEADQSAMKAEELVYEPTLKIAQAKLKNIKGIGYAIRRGKMKEEEQPITAVPVSVVDEQVPVVKKVQQSKVKESAQYKASSRKPKKNRKK